MGDVREVLGEREVPVQEKVGRLRGVLEERVVPLLGEARASVFGAASSAAAAANGKAGEGKKENGNGSVHYEEAHQVPALVSVSS